MSTVEQKILCCGGGSHATADFVYRLEVISDVFKGLTLVKRHQMVRGHASA